MKSKNLLLLTTLSTFVLSNPLSDSLLSKDCPLSHGKREFESIKLSDRRTVEKLNEKRSVPDFVKVKADINLALTQSQEFFPADFGNYGPLMIRLAWHCNGSYRKTDGRGGCDGARIRFNPEMSWEDNANLDNAIKVLEPVKEKYGDILSWGDLITLTGDVSLENMGLQTIGFCGGRIDDPDGSGSLVLGPSADQERISHCVVNGDCHAPFGPTTIGLIYVNPGGHLDIPDPKLSVKDIRDSFSRMGMNDRETVALIGGGNNILSEVLIQTYFLGHAFGKTHGACSNPPCGDGVGNNTFSSGFEGQWTETPTKWTNDFFKHLLTKKYELFKGPGGKNQWRPAGKDEPNIRMLTSDLALIEDPIFLDLVKEYAADIGSLQRDFVKTWYKLMSNDMGPATRCLGNLVPPPQPFQNPLPSPPKQLPKFSVVSKDIVKILYSSEDNGGDQLNDGRYYLGALFVELASQCLFTFRITDYAGGCNGARIRFSPERDYPDNVGLDKVLETLKPIKEKYVGLSWADLIVLAGQTAIEEAGGEKIKFIGGRTDAADGNGAEKIPPRDYYYNSVIKLKDQIKVTGLPTRETVALFGRLRSDIQQRNRNFSGTYRKSKDLNKFSNDFFKILLKEDWKKISEDEFQAKGKDIFITSFDFSLLEDLEFKSYVEEFAEDLDAFKSAFKKGWDLLSKAELNFIEKKKKTVFDRIFGFFDYVFGDAPLEADL
ncbi:hypothetical protein HK099_005168 [Clydaea vesicula]|uniref:Peroxidase n=1 Tax=Clydaea vesicula TaxID=447962 RepID=A0AAD5XZ47_9FUNG|nr:hypothetical protein HK099_005168 [Clydaea vesicula]